MRQRLIFTHIHTKVASWNSYIYAQNIYCGVSVFAARNFSTVKTGSSMYHSSNILTYYRSLSLFRTLRVLAYRVYVCECMLKILLHFAWCIKRWCDYFSIWQNKIKNISVWNWCGSGEVVSFLKRHTLFVWLYVYAKKKTHNGFILICTVYCANVCVFRHMVKGMLYTNVYNISFYPLRLLLLLIVVVVSMVCVYFDYFFLFVRIHNFIRARDSLSSVFSHTFMQKTKLSLLYVQSLRKSNTYHTYPSVSGRDIHMLFIRFNHIHVIYILCAHLWKRCKCYLKSVYVSFIRMYVCLLVYMCRKTEICMCVQYFAHYSDDDEIMGRKVLKEDTVFNYWKKGESRRFFEQPSFSSFSFFFSRMHFAIDARKVQSLFCFNSLI